MAQNQPNKIIRDNVLPWRGIEKMYLNTRTADVIFEITPNSTDGVTEQIPAHKVILAANSLVFQEMFYGDLKEEGKVTITDSTAEAFREFLQYFYCSQVTLSEHNWSNVMYLGKKYMIEKCVEATTELSKLTLSLDNVCYGYEMAIFMERDDLKKYCERIIRSMTTEVFKTKSFLNSSVHLVRSILQLDSLQCNEALVFDGCIEWAKMACKKNGLDATYKEIRSQLSDLFFEIRFGEMTISEIYQRYHIYSDHDSSLISKQEFDEIVGMIASKDYKPEKFNRSPRKLTGQLVSISRHLGTNHTSYGVQTDITAFSLNHQLVLTSITCSKIFSNDKFHHVPAKLDIIEHYGTLLATNVIPSNHFVLLSVQDTGFKLETPVYIKPNVKYAVVIELKQKVYNWYNLKSQDVLINQGIVVEFHDTPYTKKNRGLVHEMEFLILPDF